MADLAGGTTIGGYLALHKGNVSAGALNPPGTVVMVAGSNAPNGYLKCNGATISRTAYADLFAAIGTTFGAGDGSTTFKLPDLRGEFIRCWDDARGVDSGRTFGSAQASTKVAQGHSVPTVISVIGADSSEASTLGQGSGYGAGGYASTTYGLRPRNVALLACIRY